MDKEVLKRRLTERFEKSLADALAAVEAAPDGQWITASEWHVREVFQRLTAKCYQEMVQGRIDATRLALTKPPEITEATEEPDVPPTTPATLEIVFASLVVMNASA